MKFKVLLITASMVSLASAADIKAVGFSGGDGTTETALNVVLNGINSANSSIDVLAYSFSSKPIATALVNAAKRGVKVRIVADNAQNSRFYSAINYTANNSIDSKLNSNYQDFHNKVMIIDGKCVETGSFNYSASAANKNAENAIIICDKGLAQIYQNQFNRWYSQAQPVNKNY